MENIKRGSSPTSFSFRDQVYDHRRHLRGLVEGSGGIFVADHDFPTVSIPDDHDAGQPNIWGHNGKKSTLPGASDGGYAMPVSAVITWRR